MHIAGELFRRAAGIDLSHIPYKGVAPAVADTLGGQVQVLFVGYGGSLAQHFRSGKLIPLAVTEKRRSPLLPGIPTMAEAGFKGVETDAWYGVLAPLGTPPAVIARMNQEINAMLAVAEVREKMNAAGIDVRGGSFFQPGDLPRDVDAVIMKHIIHDWDAEHATKILRHCRSAMRPSGKLLVADRVLDPPNVPDPKKFFDVAMMLIPGGRERTEQEWHELYAASGFRVSRIIPTPGPLSIIEGLPV